MTRRAVATFTVSVAAALILHRLGAGRLAPPDRWSWREASGWADERGTITASMALLRLASLGAALHLTVVSAVALVAGVTRCHPVAQVASRLTPRVLRPALGLALAPLFVPADPVFAAEGAPVMVQVDGPAATDAPIMRWVGPTGSTTTITPNPAPPPAMAAVAATTTPPVPIAAPTTTAQAPAPTAPTNETWTIRRGDHLWRVAAETVENRLGRTPSTGEIGRYWRTLIEANRDRLVDPANPDLVFTGQVLTLPPQ